MTAETAETLTVGSLCSGFDGMGLGLAEVFDTVPLWFSDPDPAASAVLEHRFPDLPNLGDLTTVDWSQTEPVDIVTAGFPCQDLSLAGRRTGMRHGNRSGLWHHIARALDELQPTCVVIENVRGLLSVEADSPMELCPWCVGNGPDSGLRALGAVLGDLAERGFNAQWSLLSAVAVGAPHRRDRIFLIATHPARQRRRKGWPQPTRQLRGSDAPGGGDAATRSDGRLRQDWVQYRPAIERWEQRLGRRAALPTVLNPRGVRQLSPVFTEWAMGLPAGWVTDVPGLTRNQKLHLLGNGCLPQQVSAAVRGLWPTTDTHDRKPELIGAMLNSHYPDRMPKIGVTTVEVDPEDMAKAVRTLAQLCVRNGGTNAELRDILGAIGVPDSELKPEQEKLVGPAGVEPAISRSQTERDGQPSPQTGP